MTQLYKILQFVVSKSRLDVPVASEGKANNISADFKPSLLIFFSSISLVEGRQKGKKK